MRVIKTDICYIISDIYILFQPPLNQKRFCIVQYLLYNYVLYNTYCTTTYCTIQNRFWFKRVGTGYYYLYQLYWFLLLNYWSNNNFYLKQRFVLFYFQANSRLVSFWLNNVYSKKWVHFKQFGFAIQIIILQFVKYEKIRIYINCVHEYIWHFKSFLKW
jgi:hypothetical protein